MTLRNSQDAALGYYYYGLLHALLRYRRLTLAGWTVAAVGGGGLLASCRQAASGDLLVALMPVATLVAGLMLVHQSVAALDAYVHIRIPRPNPEESPSNLPSLIEECALLMDTVDAGGWHEAYAAIRSLRAMGLRHGLPER